MRNARYKNGEPNPKMRIITCNIPEPHIKIIEKFIAYGFHCSRSEYIRLALKNQIDKDLQLMLHEERVMAFPKHLIKIPKDTADTVNIPNGDGTYEEKKIVRRLEY